MSVLLLCAKLLIRRYMIIVHFAKSRALCEIGETQKNMTNYVRFHWNEMTGGCKFVLVKYSHFNSFAKLCSHFSGKWIQKNEHSYTYNYLNTGPKHAHTLNTHTCTHARTHMQTAENNSPNWQVLTTWFSMTVLAASWISYKWWNKFSETKFAQEFLEIYRAGFIGTAH